MSVITVMECFIYLWNAANYLENWKCISVLQADGASTAPAPPHSTGLHTSLTASSGQPGMSSSGLTASYQKEKSNNWYRLCMSADE